MDSYANTIHRKQMVKENTRNGEHEGYLFHFVLR